MKAISSILFIIIVSLVIISCDSGIYNDDKQNANDSNTPSVKVEAEDFISSNISIETLVVDDNKTITRTEADGWFEFEVNIPVSGRYKIQVSALPTEANSVTWWVEDYIYNKDDRTYDITGNTTHDKDQNKFYLVGKDGSPLREGIHKMKLHFDQSAYFDNIIFTLLKDHQKTPNVLKQNTTGETWEIVWADEFNGSKIDTSLWTYDIGNWGWGNDELQYYTEGRKENARIEDGNLIIEARKNDDGYEWTSARLTTRGKTSFIYGRIEFKAKVPSGKGNWAAGWTLGDEYIDELSWPYCGEIDILESVGYEMNDTTGNGIAHASAHSGAYYFKLGNQPTGVIDVENMNNSYHIYAVEWLPDAIYSYVDGKLYATYNDTSTDLSWPFSKPQNIILNLAMGGGWGGYYGIDSSLTSQKMIIDYVRVYELR